MHRETDGRSRLRIAKNFFHRWANSFEVRVWVSVACRVAAQNVQHCIYTLQFVNNDLIIILLSSGHRLQYTAISSARCLHSIPFRRIILIVAENNRVFLRKTLRNLKLHRRTIAIVWRKRMQKCIQNLNESSTSSLYRSLQMKLSLVALT